MSIVPYTDEEFNVFYYGLKNNFKTISKVKSIESEEFEYYSESVRLNIESYYESIFGQRFNSSLFEYYKQVYFEVKDEDERNSKIINQVIENFYGTLSYNYTEVSESRYLYFLKPLSIEKKLGFQKGDENFKNFVIKHILKEIRFKNGNYILFDDTYGTIINGIITECVKNIRCEMIKNTIDLDFNDLINDINKLELEKNVGSFDFLVTSINLLRILKADMKNQYEGFNPNVKPDIHSTTINNIENNHFYDFSQQTEIAINQEFIDIKLYDYTENNQYFDNRKETNINIENQLTEYNSYNLTEQKQYNDNREIKNISRDNHFIDINNTINNWTTTSITNNNPGNEEKNDSEKKDSNLKIKIEFSPFKFRDLLIMFFKNAGTKIDPEKIKRLTALYLKQSNSTKKSIPDSRDRHQQKQSTFSTMTELQF